MYVTVSLIDAGSLLQNSVSLLASSLQVRASGAILFHFAPKNAPETTQQQQTTAPAAPNLFDA